MTQKRVIRMSRIIIFFHGRVPLGGVSWPRLRGVGDERAYTLKKCPPPSVEEES